jgi:hypothetical protein
MRIAEQVFLKLGATQINMIDSYDDPETEEDFLKLKYISPTPITWQAYQSMYTTVEKEVIGKLLRAYRDEYLQKSDWIMTVDNFSTLRNKDEWIAYRQALRNLPANPPEIIWKTTPQRIRYSTEYLKSLQEHIATLENIGLPKSMQRPELDFKRMNMPKQPPVLRDETAK